MEQSYSFNARVVQSKTASYSVLVTDDEIQVAPAADGVIITLPAHSALSGAMLAHKVFKIKKTSTGNYPVKIVPTSPDTINGGQDAIYLYGNGEEVIVGSSVTGDWKPVYASVFGFLAPALDSGKYANISIETNALTGQINGMEISMTGPNGAATGSNSYCTLRVRNFLTGTNIMTGRAAFIGCYANEDTDEIFSGQQVGLSVEVGNARANATVTTGVLELSTRSAAPYTTYHKASAYIQIRDYHASALGAGCLPNLLSIMDANMAWTIPATDVNALVTTSSDQLQTHAIRINVGGTALWIMCTSDTPD